MPYLILSFTFHYFRQNSSHKISQKEVSPSPVNTTDAKEPSCMQIRQGRRRRTCRINANVIDRVITEESNKLTREYEVNHKTLMDDKEYYF